MSLGKGARDDQGHLFGAEVGAVTGEAARSVPGAVPQSEGGVPPGVAQGAARGGIWAGKLGGLLYGAYIAKRMWGMTAAPVIQDMQQYAATEAGTAPMEFYGRSEEMNLSGAGGLIGRQSESQYRMGKAAYQSWGIIADYGTLLTQNATVNRGIATGRVVGGVAAASYILGNTQVAQQIVGMLGGEQLGNAAQAGGARLAPILGRASAVLGGISLGMEGINAIDAYQSARTGTDYHTIGEEGNLGSFWRFLNRAKFAGDAWQTNLKYGEEEGGRRTQQWIQENPEYWNWMSAPETNPADTPQMKKLSSGLSKLAIQTGRKREEIAPGYFSYQRTLGRPLTDEDIRRVC